MSLPNAQPTAPQPTPPSTDASMYTKKAGQMIGQPTAPVPTAPMSNRAMFTKKPAAAPSLADPGAFGKAKA